jgi:RNA polymerase sigma factor (sigma-70 family)
MSTEQARESSGSNNNVIYMKSRSRGASPALGENELSILERVAAGEQRAVEICLEKFGNLVWSLARRYLGNSSEAEDAVQEIFIEIWSCAHRFDRASGSEATFIATITRRRLIDRIRKNGRKPAIASLTNDVGGQYEPPVESRLEDATDVQLVARAIKSMDSDSRKILSMALGDGHTHTEIAALLEVPLGTVKTKVRRGLIQIREQLKIASELPLVGQA